ncbi:alanyl-tRNA editing protein Aarsd1-like isoform X1 [Tupaia chinensis]|uniref:alanyl-tRNA editing protein Aarsd1-like isoform X1 n=1 Tax=Tupaia chinensis TaxID=246437 RepID=UPI000704067E|nr:alanyl-tRNA editing protein Aarsd1-like isoform X1 [Tupaia chinensis]
MAFRCQRDSYAREVRSVAGGTPSCRANGAFSTTVVSCSPAELQTEGSNGKKEVLSGFNVVLEDTLLFPEGGGQVPGQSLSPTPSQAPDAFVLE